MSNRPTSIYVIDDEAIDAMICKLLIKRLDESIDVDAISSGQNAIDQLVDISINQPEELPDYIFLDLNMPGMNGWKFLNEYERLDIDRLKKINIYVLSSSIYYEDIAKCQSNPFVKDFLNKPLNLENLKTIFKAA